MPHRAMRPATIGPVAPLHRGPQALPATYGTTIQHAPNAALLIDFDNVTMGIRSDLASELRNLLSSEIIKGKVAVQRAYADWRRYPQYIVPLAESSIDMIMAPAYGSSKKNATDIRLSVDAMELVFTRPEIGTYILLSGDSDFASLVTKLKEYGKYVIGVGIKESSSDLLVMNCDEYYSYNALAGLVKQSEEDTTKWDPWELVVEAITRMQKNGDVMRSDRLKQVMQDIDATFDEKNVGHGYSKFSKFVTDAVDKGLLSVTKLENGQLEVLPGEGAAAGAAPRVTPIEPRATTDVSSNGREERGGRRGRRGRGGRGRDRAREERGATTSTPAPAAAQPEAAEGVTESAPQAPAPRKDAPPAPADGIGIAGARLTRNEAFDLVRRATAALVNGDDAVLSGLVRTKAFELLERDSESLAPRNFHRVLRDAHDAEVIDLRRRGDDYEVSLPAAAASVVEQLNRAEAAHAATAAAAAPSAPPPVRGMTPRGIPSRGRASAPPPELLMVGVVDAPAAIASDAEPAKPPRGAKAAKQVRTAKDKSGPEAAAPKPARARGTKAAKKTAVRK